jgi:hypothetical protein
LRNRGQGGAGRNADQQTFFGCTAATHFAGGVSFDLNHAIEQGGVQVLRNEARANALNGVGRRRAA